MVARTITEAARAGRLTIKGRPPAEIEFERIPKATWHLAAINVVPDNATIWKFEVVPCHGVDPERIERVLSYDSLTVNLEEFQSIFDAIGPADSNDSG